MTFSKNNVDVQFNMEIVLIAFSADIDHQFPFELDHPITEQINQLAKH